MKKLMNAGLVLPATISATVLENAEEASRALADSVYVSAIEILEIQGYELGFREDLSIEELRDLRDELDHKSVIRAKVSVRYEELATAEVERVRTLDDCAKVSEKIGSCGKARELFNARHAEIVTAEVETLLTGEKTFGNMARAYQLSHWCPEAMKGLVLRNLAGACKALDECLQYVRVERFARSRKMPEHLPCFEEIFWRALGHCKSRDDVKNLRDAIFDDPHGSWVEEDRKYYGELLQEAAARQNLALLETVKEHAQAMRFYRDSRGEGPFSKEAEKKFLAVAVEMANFNQLRELLAGVGPLDSYHCVNEELREKGLARWEELSLEKVWATNTEYELACLLEAVPAYGNAWKVCFRKYLGSISSAKEAYEFFISSRSGGEEEKAAVKRRYEKLALREIRAAHTPSQIADALSNCHGHPVASREGVAKFAEFYRIPAKAA